MQTRINVRVFRAPSGRELRVYVVYDRLLRRMLIWERVSLPVGIGGLIGGIAGFATHAGRLSAIDIAAALAPALVLAIGLWRPWHRIVGFSLTTTFCGPDK